MAEIVEIEVCKGLTKQVSDKDWQRIEYSLKAKLDAPEKLQVAKAQLEAVIDNWLQQAFQGKETRSTSLDEAYVKQLFLQDLQFFLSFKKEDKFFIIQPRQFLSSENFAKIASAVRELGGEYIAKGKESHFRVPLKQ
ncbi:MAG: hypothetical protein ACUVTB_06750 [Candidatus Bathycorpusculaceae bacterium]